MKGNFIDEFMKNTPGITIRHNDGSESGVIEVETFWKILDRIKKEQKNEG